MDLALPWSPPGLEAHEKLPYKVLKGLLASLLWALCQSITLLMLESLKQWYLH